MFAHTKTPLDGRGPGRFSAAVQRFLDTLRSYRISALDSLQVLEAEEDHGDYRAPRGGSVWEFDGSTSEASVPDFLNLGSAFTFCCRVRFAASGAHGLVSQYTTPGNQRSTRWLNSAGRQRMYLSSDGINGTSYLQSGGSTLAANTTYHLAVRFAASSLTFFTDGVQNGSVVNTSQSSVFDSSGLVRVGAGFQASSLGEILNGQIWDIRIFNFGLLDQEIAEIAGQWTRHGSEIAHWAGCEESGPTGYDITENARHMSLTNVTHAEQPDALVSVANSEGYRLSGGVVVPSRDGIVAADGSPLDVTGRCPFPAVSIVPAILNDGGAVSLSAPHLTGAETVVSWTGSTAQPTVSAGTLNWDAGETLGEIVLSDGTHYPGQEGSSRGVYDVSGGGNHAAIVGGTNIWSTITGARDWIVLHGGRLVAGVMVPGLADGSAAANGNPLTHSAGKHGNPYSRIDTNFWEAPELVAIGAERALAPTDARETVPPANTKFSRISLDTIGGNAGTDRFLAFLEAAE